jgi:hypothetical protein
MVAFLPPPRRAGRICGAGQAKQQGQRGGDAAAGGRSHRQHIIALFQARIPAPAVRCRQRTRRPNLGNLPTSQPLPKYPQRHIPACPASGCRSCPSAVIHCKSGRCIGRRRSSPFSGKESPEFYPLPPRVCLRVTLTTGEPSTVNPQPSTVNREP